MCIRDRRKGQRPADGLRLTLQGQRRRKSHHHALGQIVEWIDTLKAVTAAAVSDEQMAHAAERFPIHTPQNKEEYY